MVTVIWANRNIVRMTMPDGEILYWNGAWFVWDSREAKRYKTLRHARRVIDAVKSSVRTFGCMLEREPVLFKSMGTMEACVCTIETGCKTVWVARTAA